MTPELIERVADFYFTTKAKGLGLGLTLARKMIERFSGSLAIAGITGRGTVVTITLKADNVRAARASDQDAPTPETPIGAPSSKQIFRSEPKD